jgi:hypothetical protein
VARGKQSRLGSLRYVWAMAPKQACLEEPLQITEKHLNN